MCIYLYKNTLQKYKVLTTILVLLYLKWLKSFFCFLVGHLAKLERKSQFLSDRKHCFAETTWDSRTTRWLWTDWGTSGDQNLLLWPWDLRNSHQNLWHSARSLWPVCCSFSFRILIGSLVMFELRSFGFLDNHFRKKIDIKSWFLSVIPIDF